MTLTEEHTEQAIISSYAPGTICIAEKSYQSSLLITPKSDILIWPIEQLNELTEAHCQEMIAYHPEVIIIGTGEHHQLPDLTLIHFFTRHKVGIEMMNT